MPRRRRAPEANQFTAHILYNCYKSVKPRVRFSTLLPLSAGGGVAASLVQKRDCLGDLLLSLPAERNVFFQNTDHHVPLIVIE